MSFYSSLCLVANTGFKLPSEPELKALFESTGMLKPNRVEQRFGNLTSEFWNHFDKLPERTQNEDLFRPDTISGRSRIELHDIDGDFAGKGFSISISGPGYFWPLTTDDLRNVTHHPKLRHLACEAAERFGGRFVPPLIRGKKTLRKNLIDDSGPWHWFGSQSL